MVFLVLAGAFIKGIFFHAGAHVVTGAVATHGTAAVAGGAAVAAHGTGAVVAAHGTKAVVRAIGPVINSVMAGKMTIMVEKTTDEGSERKLKKLLTKSNLQKYLFESSSSAQPAPQLLVVNAEILYHLITRKQDPIPEETIRALFETLEGIVGATDRVLMETMRVPGYPPNCPMELITPEKKYTQLVGRFPCMANIPERKGLRLKLKGDFKREEVENLRRNCVNKFL